MADEKCRHWYHEHDDSNNYWCRDCNVNLRTENFWGGRFNLGKIETAYETAAAELLDIRALLQSQLGTTVDLLNVIINGENSWDLKYTVVFGVGKNTLTVYITASKSERFVPLDTFHVVEGAVEV